LHGFKAIGGRARRQLVAKGRGLKGCFLGIRDFLARAVSGPARQAGSSAWLGVSRWCQWSVFKVSLVCNRGPKAISSGMTFEQFC
jgi:hypothetical protein